MGLTVKDFAKTLKIKDDALLERMKAAGLSHSKASDEITPADKLAILKSLKERKGTASSSVTSSSSSGGVTVKSKGTLSQPTSSTTNSSEGLSDNIEAKRQAAAENLKEQQQKREDQIKEAIRLKQEQQQAAKKSQQQKSTPQKNLNQESILKISYREQPKITLEEKPVLVKAPSINLQNQLNSSSVILKFQK